MLDTLSVLLQRLTEVISALAPVDGIALLSIEKQAVRIDFNLAATKEQMTAANDALRVFDWSDAANEKWFENQNVTKAQTRIEMQVELVASIMYILGQISIAVPGYKTPSEQEVIDSIKRALEAQKTVALVVVK